MIDQVTKDVAESIGLGKPTGALVRSVEAGGPADKAGVEAGDIITKVDGRTVDKSGDLPRIIGGMKPGSKAALQVFRRGAYKDLAVTVAEFEAERPRRGAEREAPEAAAGVDDLARPRRSPTSPMRRRRELKIKGGVKVDSVEGAAQRAGLREGDIILAIDNIEVSNAKQFETLVAKLDKSKPVTLLVRRGDSVNFVIVRPRPEMRENPSRPGLVRGRRRRSSIPCPADSGLQLLVPGSKARPGVWKNSLVTAHMAAASASD